MFSIKLVIVLFTVLVSLQIIPSQILRGWKYYFPSGSAMGLFLALAIPLDLPNKSVFIAYNFEANYLLPTNLSADYEYPPILSDRSGRKIDRSVAYDVLESKLDKQGYPGHACLLRTICEASMSTFDFNGVLGDIIHIILTPSSSSNEELSSVYLEAEKTGREKKDCSPYKQECKTSILDIITWMTNRAKKQK